MRDHSISGKAGNKISLQFAPHQQDKETAAATLQGQTNQAGAPIGFDFGKMPMFPPQGEEITLETKNKKRANNKNYLSAGLTNNQNDNQFIGGRTFGELVGDIGRPFGTVLGNVDGSIAGSLIGNRIFTNTNSGPSWNDHGHFDWKVGFSTNGRNGWIVQKIENTYRADDKSGNPLAGAKPTSEYWEAWAVNAAGNVTPNIGPDNDYWIRPNKGVNSQGHWSMTGKVYFTTKDPSNRGMTPGGVRDAGILLSGTTSPGWLGIPRLHRYAQGTWDSTGAIPTHTGSAR